MAGPHQRSPSPSHAEPSLQKRQKVDHNPQNVATDSTSCFVAGLFHPNNVKDLNATYTTSGPFKHAVIPRLFQDSVLQGVRDECLSQLSFTEKETDIYKVHQTGDLASLNYLTKDQLSLLPNLLVLRDALYSERYRDFVRTVTGCGPLSASKQDMSVNTYVKGCHLLNHDDVIGTRRVSYILYMPLPEQQAWQPEWGGALELYPTRDGPDGTTEPVPMPSKSIPPSWNQFVFFEVQPGKSFHSVEEVVVEGGVDGRQRLSISGWFHAAQFGEPGYHPDTEKLGVKSSRDQLAATATTFKPYPDAADPSLPDQPLSKEDLSFLSEYLNPVYLKPHTIEALRTRFAEESSLELHSFLAAHLADQFSDALVESDRASGLGPDRPQHIPHHTAGIGGDWVLKGPPHKWRYCVLGPVYESHQTEHLSPLVHSPLGSLMRKLQDDLFPSPTFRAWLANISQLLPLRWNAEARRFRPGLDYTLATSEDEDARLDVVLGLTPDVADTGAHVPREDDGIPTGWQSGEWGGWECYMAPHEGEDDPAVYQSSPQKNNPNSDKPQAQDEEAGDDEDGTLLAVQPGFNRLLLVLRDQGVMRFVKYVSAAAPGSRWDVCGEFECGVVELED